MRILFLRPSPFPLHSFLASRGGAREVELSANASCPPVGAESWSWPPCPQPLISTVTGEVRPPSTHRQPLVQSHSPAINKKLHLHKLTGTQCSHPSHLQGLHIHIDWLGPTVWPTWLLLFFFIFIFFKCMQSSVTVEAIRICYYRLREFEGCTQFSEHSLLMSRIKCNINQPHVTTINSTQSSELSDWSICRHPKRGTLSQFLGRISFDYISYSFSSLVVCLKTASSANMLLILAFYLRWFS